MIAVVYSGSRFADWKLADKTGIVANFKTSGINPFFNDEQFILNLLNKTNQLINHAEKIRRIYFFGAGASSPERQEIIGRAFRSFFKRGKVQVDHDLKAAAIATCGESSGIVGILGSGSNAGYYDGKKIRENNFGLGYILGDEGSANWLGRQLLKKYLNQTLDPDLNELFKKRFDLDRKQILEKVYNQPQPALFLSSFADFLSDHKNHPAVSRMVSKGFGLYFATYVQPLISQFSAAPVHFVGTVAADFEDQLRDTANIHGISMGKVLREPIYNVLTFYSNQN